MNSWLAALPVAGALTKPVTGLIARSFGVGTCGGVNPGSNTSVVKSPILNDQASAMSLRCTEPVATKSSSGLYLRRSCSNWTAAAALGIRFVAGWQTVGSRFASVQPVTSELLL